jgi:hypothetical protein
VLLASIIIIDEDERAPILKPWREFRIPLTSTAMLGGCGEA